MHRSLNKKLAFALGTVFFTLALTWQAPASLLSNTISERTSGHLLLTQAEGSIWKGKANVAIASSIGQAGIGKLHWETFPYQLLMGNFHVEFTWNQSAPNLLTISLNGINIEHLNIEIPASAIAHFAPSLNAAQLGGQVHIESEKLFVSEKVIEGNTRLEWSQASSPLSPVNPLGQYQATLTGLGSALNVQLSTASGALLLEGSGSWSAQGGLNFQGTASAQKEHLVALTPLLHMIGNEDVAGSGNYRFNF